MDSAEYYRNYKCPRTCKEFLGDNPVRLPSRITFLPRGTYAEGYGGRLVMLAVLVASALLLLHSYANKSSDSPEGRLLASGSRNIAQVDQHGK